MWSRDDFVCCNAVLSCMSPHLPRPCMETFAIHFSRVNMCAGIYEAHVWCIALTMPGYDFVFAMPFFHACRLASLARAWRHSQFTLIDVHLMLDCDINDRPRFFFSVSKIAFFSSSFAPSKERPSCISLAMAGDFSSAKLSMAMMCLSDWHRMATSTLTQDRQ